MDADSTHEVPVYKMPPEIAAGLVKAQQSVGWVAKNGKNSHANYKYATSEDLIDAAREALNGAGLAFASGSWSFTPDTSMAVEKDGKDGQRVTVGCVGFVHVTHYLSHGSGVGVAFVTDWPVVPEKGRPIDKALAASLTTCEAYALRNLLQIPRGDEPGTGQDDTDRSARAAREERRPSGGGNGEPFIAAEEQHGPAPAPAAQPWREVMLEYVGKIKAETLVHGIIVVLRQAEALGMDSVSINCVRRCAVRRMIDVALSAAGLSDAREFAASVTDEGKPGWRAETDRLISEKQAALAAK